MDKGCLFDKGVFIKCHQCNEKLATVTCYDCPSRKGTFSKHCYTCDQKIHDSTKKHHQKEIISYSDILQKTVMSPKQGFANSIRPETDYRTEKASRIQVKRNDYSNISNKESAALDREERKREMMAKLHDLRMKVSTPSKARESLEVKYDSKPASKLESKVESKQSSSHKYNDSKPKLEYQTPDPAVLDRLSILENLVFNLKSQIENQSPRKKSSKHKEAKIKEIGENMEKIEIYCNQIASNDEGQIEFVVIALNKASHLIQLSEELKENLLTLEEGVNEIRKEQAEQFNEYTNALNEISKDSGNKTDSFQNMSDEFKEKMLKVIANLASTLSKPERNDENDEEKEIAAMKAALKEKEKEIHELKESISTVQQRFEEEVKIMEQGYNEREEQVSQCNFAHQDEEKVQAKKELFENYNELMSLYQKCQEERDEAKHERDQLQTEMEYCRKVFEELGLLKGEGEGEGDGEVDGEMEDEEDQGFPSHEKEFHSENEEKEYIEGNSEEDSPGK